MGTLAVGRVAEPVRLTLGAATAEVLLSADTMEKQRVRHSDLTEADYLLASTVLREPTVVVRHQQRHLTLLRAGARTLVAVIKVTGDGRELFLVSLHAAKPKSVRTMLRRDVVFGSKAGFE